MKSKGGRKIAQLKHMNGKEDVENIGRYGAPVIVDTWTTGNDCN